MRAIDDIKLGFSGAEGVFRLMAVNISVFLLISIGKLILFLSGGDSGMGPILEKIAMKSDPSALLFQPWSIITYMFVHENFLHILFNMLILFWFGKIFCEFISSSKVVAVYLLGGLAGALIYVGAYQLFPVFESARNASILIGASAGVIAVVVAIATLLPDYSMHLLLFGPVRLKFIAIFMVLLYLISIPDGNAGGNLSHLGGAIFGFTFTKLYQSGTDIVLWLEKTLSFFSSIFNRRSHIKVVHRTEINRGKPEVKGQPRQEVIDAILDKISRSGYNSLTEKERETLFKASKSHDK